MTESADQPPAKVCHNNIRPPLQALSCSFLFPLHPHPPLMASLARDAAAFQTALKRQDYSWRSQPAPPQQAADSSVADGDPKKKKRPKSSTSLLLDSSALGVSHG